MGPDPGQGKFSAIQNSNYLSIQHHQSCFFNPHVSCLTSQALLVKKQLNHDQKPPGHFCWFPMASMDVQSLFSVGFSFVFPHSPRPKPSTIPTSSLGQPCIVHGWDVLRVAHQQTHAPEASGGMDRIEAFGIEATSAVILFPQNVH